MARCRLAIFCRSLEGGGAERVMTTLANGLAGKGHDVFLVLSCGAGPYLREVARNVHLVDLACRTPATALLPFKRFLDRERPSAALATLVGENAIAVAASRLLSRRHRPRVVVREANTLSVALRFRGRVDRTI